ncbi:hypothetical protein [Kamptonema formosum]|nr:hypothetical protein [Oscillatoria sp. PCC 10802]
MTQDGHTMALAVNCRLGMCRHAHQHQQDRRPAAEFPKLLDKKAILW